MCENQEHIFHLCKDITRKTSSNHPGHIIGNLILRHQIEKKINSDEIKTPTYENDISKKYKCLQSICLESRNTVFSKKFIKENNAEWQCQLERLSDYFYQGQNVWWKVNEIGIEFMDGSLNQDIKDGPLLRHFRSSSIADIRNGVTNYWEMCITEKVVLPAYVIIGSDDTENLTNFFDDNRDHDFSIPIQCQPLTGEEEEEELYNYDEIHADVTPEIDSVSLHIEDVPCTDPVPCTEPFTACKGGYNISTPKKDMQYQSHSTSPGISPIQNQMQSDIHTEYRTKEANMLHLILGSNELVQSLDKAKNDLKVSHMMIISDQNI